MNKVDFLLRYIKYTRTNINGCIEWIASLDNHGYGQMTMHGKARKAHILAYIFFKGKRNKSLDIDHLCMNKACCNPEHLEQVTHRVNMLRGNSPVAVNAR